jgi:hypothetical protein
VQIAVIANLQIGRLPASHHGIRMNRKERYSSRLNQSCGADQYTLSSKESIISTSFSAIVANKLGIYVYIYINPLNDQVFYVGKGKGNRAFSHLEDPGPSAKSGLISEIRTAGYEPRIEILVHGLKDEETALKIEAAVIDLYPPGTLTNEIRGYHSRSHGRMRLGQVNAIYGAKRVDIAEPALLIRINKLYRHTMTPPELYEVTRGFWKVGPDRDKVKLAMAVYARVIREVYEVQAWFPAGSTFTTRSNADSSRPNRWEFVGRVANEAVRKKYLHRSVAHYFPKASQNPIQYVNVE